MSEDRAPVFDPRRILLELVDRGVAFVVVGGVAVQAHGHGRATRDLDVIARPDLLNLSRLSEALAGMSARLVHGRRAVDVTDPQLIRGAPLVPLMTTYGRLDLLNLETTAGAPRAYEDLRARAVEADIDGRVVAVAGIDDLIRMKRSAGRDVDLEDIAALTRSDDELRDEAGQST